MAGMMARKGRASMPQAPRVCGSRKMMARIPPTPMTKRRVTDHFDIEETVLSWESTSSRSGIRRRALRPASPASRAMTTRRMSSGRTLTPVLTDTLGPKNLMACSPRRNAGARSAPTITEGTPATSETKKHSRNMSHPRRRRVAPARRIIANSR